MSLLTLTDEGEQVVQELIEQRKAFFGSALADWDHDDVRQLAVLMGRLTDALDAQADRPETFDSRKVTA